MQIKILAVVISGLISVFTIQSGLDDVSLSGIVHQESVNFMINNNGTSTVTLTYIITYIVIQDNILELTQGQTTLNPGDVENIQITKPSSDMYLYELKVVEQPLSGGSGAIKIHTIQG